MCCGWWCRGPAVAASCGGGRQQAAVGLATQREWTATGRRVIRMGVRVVRRKAGAAADRRYTRMRFGREGEGRRIVLLLLGSGRNDRRCGAGRQIQRTVCRRRNVASEAEVLRVGQIQAAHVVAGTHRSRRLQTVAVRSGQTRWNALARRSPVGQIQRRRRWLLWHLW